MPLVVKAFSALGALLVVIWIYHYVAFIAFPSEHYISMVAKLPTEIRDETRHYDVVTRGVSTLVWSVIVLLFGWLAAFRRRNWARWALLVIFVVAELIPFVAMGVFYLDDPDIQRITPYSLFAWEELAAYARPGNFVVASIKIVMLFLIYSPKARPWMHAFKAHARRATAS